MIPEKKNGVKSKIVQIYCKIRINFVFSWESNITVVYFGSF